MLTIPVLGIIGLTPPIYHWYCTHQGQENCQPPEILDAPLIAFKVFAVFLDKITGLLMAIATIIAAVYAIKLWETTERQACISERQTAILEHQTEWMKADSDRKDEFEKIKIRARLNMSIYTTSVYIESNITPEFIRKIKIEPIISNDGETAADSIVILARIAHGPQREDLTDLIEIIQNDVKFVLSNTTHHLSNTTNKTSIAYPQKPSVSLAGRNRSEKNFWANPITIDCRDFKKTGNEKPHVLFYTGLVKYKDVFESVWVKRFIWQVLIDSDFRRTINVWERWNSETKHDTPHNLSKIAPFPGVM